MWENTFATRSPMERCRDLLAFLQLLFDQRCRQYDRTRSTTEDPFASVGFAAGGTAAGAGEAGAGRCAGAAAAEIAGKASTRPLNTSSERTCTRFTIIISRGSGSG